jgi:hypothetical protein
MLDSWALFIDVEGFSPIFKKDRERAIIMLGHLMQGLYRIGTRLFSYYPQRLFIYQFGDGFLVCPQPGLRNDFLRPVGIAIGLMHSVLLQGGVLKAAIAFGEIADIFGCYPKEIQDAMYPRNKMLQEAFSSLNSDLVETLSQDNTIKNREDGIVPIGDGLMSINQIMGTALINAYGAAKGRCAPRGPVLILHHELGKDIRSQLQKMQIKTYRCDDHICINWIHSEIALVKTILEEIGVSPPDKDILCDHLNKYIARNRNLHHDWITNAKYLINNVY